MNLCNTGHEEVCFEGRSCPVCEMESEKDKAIEKLENQISALENQIGEQDGVIDSLQDEIKDLNTQINDAQNH